MNFHFWWEFNLNFLFLIEGRFSLKTATKFRYTILRCARRFWIRPMTWCRLNWFQTSSELIWLRFNISWLIKAAFENRRICGLIMSAHYSWLHAVLPCRWLITNFVKRAKLNDLFDWCYIILFTALIRQFKIACTFLTLTHSTSLFINIWNGSLYNPNRCIQFIILSWKHSAINDVQLLSVNYDYDYYDKYY